MKIRLYSDLHNEISMFVPPEREDDKDTVCVLAGDIGVISKPNTILPFLEACCNQFKHVIYVPGNHEYYNFGHFYEGWDDLKQSWNTLFEEDVVSKNISFLKDSYIEIDNTIFIGSTLWTDFNKEDEVLLKIAHRILNDYINIKTGNEFEGYQNITAKELLMAHKASRNYIFSSLKKKNPECKYVVITHHSPSPKSVAEKYQHLPEARLVNSLYYSDLEEEIISHKPDLWLHGHTHTSFDYTVEDTRIVCNPRGYQKHSYPVPENFSFNPEIVIEV